MKINIKDKENVSLLLKESVDKFGKSTGKYPEYYIMNLKTFNKICGDTMYDSECMYIRNDNGRYVYYFRGFPVAICEHLEDGTIDIR